MLILLGVIIVGIVSQLPEDEVVDPTLRIHRDATGSTNLGYLSGRYHIELMYRLDAPDLVTLADSLLPPSPLIVNGVLVPGMLDYTLRTPPCATGGGVTYNNLEELCVVLRRLTFPVQMQPWADTQLH